MCEAKEWSRGGGGEGKGREASLTTPPAYSIPATYNLPPTYTTRQRNTFPLTYTTQEHSLKTSNLLYLGLQTIL